MSPLELGFLELFVGYSMAGAGVARICDRGPSWPPILATAVGFILAFLAGLQASAVIQ